MKKILIHIVSIVLLLTVGASSLSAGNFLAEKDSLEMEDSSEELKEGKTFEGLLFGPDASNCSGVRYLVINKISLGKNLAQPFPCLTTLLPGKYLLFQNLRI